MKRFLFLVLLTTISSISLYAQMTYPLCIPKKNSAFTCSTDDSVYIPITTTDTLIQVSVFEEKINRKTFKMARVKYYRSPWLPVMNIRVADLDFLKDQCATSADLRVSAPPPPQPLWIEAAMEEKTLIVVVCILGVLVLGFRIWQKVFDWFAPFSIRGIPVFMAITGFILILLTGFQLVISPYPLVDGNFPMTRFIYKACFLDPTILNAPNPTGHDLGFVIGSVLLPYVLLPIYLQFTIAIIFMLVAYMNTRGMPEHFTQIGHRFIKYEATKARPFFPDKSLVDMFFWVWFFIIPYLLVANIFPSDPAFLVRKAMVYFVVFLLLHFSYRYFIRKLPVGRQIMDKVLQPIIGYAAVLWLIFGMLIWIRVIVSLWEINQTN